MPRAPLAYCPQCATPLEDRPYEGETRRGCPACDYMHYDNPIPVAAVIVEHEGTVILTRQAHWPPKMFGLVTGFVERGEDPAETARREVAEELGLEVEAPTLIGVYGFTKFNQVIIGYHAVAHGTPAKSDELEAIKAVPIERLRPWPFGTGHAIRDWLASRGREAT